jgi:hypothetical protein
MQATIPGKAPGYMNHGKPVKVQTLKKKAKKYTK